eukprot:c12739_g1_i1.p1 GENE.c12739_g1_i1~~c12739_g1_i1.p1  ORF type:complete len:337 (-),score=162.54 c12739_g1_i1:118-1128(-)
MIRFLFIVLIFFISFVFSERVYEQERDSRIRGHRHASYNDAVDYGNEEDIVDEHRGIPVVEDDVPEWVKLTFADKFIALGGPSEFISIEENVPKKSSKKDGEYEYEYVYSDEEGFEFDAEKDTLIEVPKESHKDKQPETKTNKNGDDDNDESESESDSDSVSLLEVNTSSSSPPSHVPGSRRAKRQNQMKTKSNEETETIRNNIYFLQNQNNIKTLAPTSFIENASKRYSVFGGKIGLNPNDPRAKKLDKLLGEEMISSFLETENNQQINSANPNLKLVHDDSDVTAKNHREWLHKHTSADDKKLNFENRKAYPNGLPVADWEVGYVDNVLKQYGY